MAFHLPSIQECFVQYLVEMGLVVLEKRIFKYFYIILIFRYYLPLEKRVAMHLNKLESRSGSDSSIAERSSSAIDVIVTGPQR